MATSELSADTRARLLDAAWALVRERGMDAVSVKDVAAAAGVSRQLVYFHYGNRAGLLAAMARHHDAASGFGRRVARARSLEPLPALEALVRAWCAYLPDLLPVARALEAALVTGDEGGSIWRERMGELHAAFLGALERVAADGGLARGWTAATAADWLWAGVQPSTYAHLVEERGWPPAEFERRALSTLLGELLAGPRPATRRTARP